MLNQQTKEDLLWLYHNEINDDLCEWSFWATLRAVGLEEEMKALLEKEKKD